LLLDYDPLTGVFVWRESKGRAKKGSVAGSLRPDGYLKVVIDGQQYLLHRLAWFYVYGVWPSETVDHKDTNRQNNAIENLREATYQQNNCNKLNEMGASGFKGVSWHSCSRKWMARIKSFRKTVYLGIFDTPEQAHEAYCAAAREVHGEFARAA
jgi:hypothetical protein